VKNGTCLNSKSFFDGLETCGTFGEYIDVFPMFIYHVSDPLITNVYNETTGGIIGKRLTHYEKSCYSIKENRFFSRNDFFSRYFIPIVYFLPKFVGIFFIVIQLIIVIAILVIPEVFQGVSIIIRKKYSSLWRFVFSIRNQMIFLLVLKSMVSLGLIGISYIFYLYQFEYYVVFISEFGLLSTIFFQMTFLWDHITKQSKGGSNTISKGSRFIFIKLIQSIFYLFVIPISLIITFMSIASFSILIFWGSFANIFAFVNLNTVFVFLVIFLVITFIIMVCFCPCMILWLGISPIATIVILWVKAIPIFQILMKGQEMKEKLKLFFGMKVTRTAMIITVSLVILNLALLGFVSIFFLSLFFYVISSTETFEVLFAIFFIITTVEIVVVFIILQMVAYGVTLSLVNLGNVRKTYFCYIKLNED
jgi:hypothetical protein